MSFEPIAQRAVGRWKSLLPAIGIASHFLSGKHGPCPMCDGTDRWRFDNKGGTGSWICSHCGAGTGIELVMRIKRLAFVEAVREVEQHIGESKVVLPRATTGDDEKRRVEMAALWRAASPLDGHDTASRYLAERGITLAAWPISLRCIDNLAHYSEAKERTLHPALLAKFAAADGKSSMLHRTYLHPLGGKAMVDRNKMFAPGRVPPGGAVRLFPAGETLGIAEGIETALSAAQLFGVPVWAACTSGAMVKWQPPKTVKCVMIFADHDRNSVGQSAAYGLAYRLHSEKFHVDVRVPEYPGDDWNDHLMAGKSADDR